MRGTLVIRDPRDPRKPVDTAVQISEYRNVPGEQVTDTLSKTGVVVLPLVASLINGVGQLPSAGCGNNPSGPNCRYARVRGVAAPCTNPQTRLRFVHVGSSFGYNVSVDHHRLIVISADSTPLTPFEVSSRGARVWR